MKILKEMNNLKDRVQSIYWKNRWKNGFGRSHQKSTSINRGSTISNTKSQENCQWKVNRGSSSLTL